MQCVSDADLMNLIEVALDEVRRGVIEQHLDECAECLELVTLASKTSLAARASTVPALRPDHGIALPEGGALAPGTALGRYEIVEPLGRGGMGMVYAARDVQLGRRRHQGRRSRARRRRGIAARAPARGAGAWYSRTS